MNNATKMLMLNSMNNDMNGMESRRRSRMENSMEMENRFRDRNGRPHYNNGRYAPRRRSSYMEEEQYDPSEYDDTENRYNRSNEMRYNGMESMDRYNRRNYGRRNEMNGMRQIGFSPNSMEQDPSRYRSEITHKNMDEMYSHGGGDRQSGYAQGGQEQELSKEDIMEWMENLENEDGTHGAHWDFKKSKMLMEQHNIHCDPLDFYAALNMMYSDYCKVAQKMNCAKDEFFVYMAKAFLDDKDSNADDKLSAYYFAIIE